MNHDKAVTGLIAILGGFVFGLWLAVLFGLIGCGATYTDTKLVETNWYGRVTTVQGGETVAKPLGISPVAGILDTLWSVTGLLVVLGLLFVLLLWKVPALRSLVTLRRLRKPNVP